MTSGTIQVSQHKLTSSPAQVSGLAANLIRSMGSTFGKPLHIRYAVTCCRFSPYHDLGIESGLPQLTLSSVVAYVSGLSAKLIRTNRYSNGNVFHSLFLVFSQFLNEFSLRLLFSVSFLRLQQQKRLKHLQTLISHHPIRK